MAASLYLIMWVTLDLVAVFGEEEERMAMVAEMEEEGWSGDD